MTRMSRRNQTNPDDLTLTPQQETAVDLLVIGKTITDAAETIGVTRQTVSEWLNQHAGFQAAVNRRRQELWEELIDSLRNLVPKALQVLEGKMEGEAPSLMAAVYTLKAAGLYRIPLPNGETDAEEIAIRQRQAASLKAMERMLIGPTTAPDRPA